MTKKRIKQLADYFYSSNDSNVIPLRLAAIRGMYAGFDLSKRAFIDLLTILNKSENLTNDLTEYISEYKE